MNAKRLWMILLCGFLCIVTTGCGNKSILMDGTANTTSETNVSNSSESSDDENNSILSKLQDIVPGSVKPGDIITFGHYEQDGSLDNGLEDIEWIVLDTKDGETLVISKYILDFGEAPIPMESSYLCRWLGIRKRLNEEILGIVFTEEEQKQIQQTSITTDEYINEFGMPETYSSTDLLFCLSLDEYEKYAEINGLVKAIPTVYAFNTYVKDNYYGDEGCEGIASWWLRSMDENGDCASAMFTDGIWDKDGNCTAVMDTDGTWKEFDPTSNCTNFFIRPDGLRPAMWVRLK